MYDGEETLLRGIRDLKEYINDIDTGQEYWQSGTWPSVRAGWQAVVQAAETTHRELQLMHAAKVIQTDPEQGKKLFREILDEQKQQAT